MAYRRLRLPRRQLIGVRIRGCSRGSSRHHDHARPDAPAQELAQMEPGLVCLAFVVFYIPDFLRGTGAGRRLERHGRHRRGPRDHRAASSGATYQAQLQAYRSAYGGNMNEQLLKQLGVEQQILQQMVDERAALAEAERLGIRVERRGSPRSGFSRIPAFQENGAVHRRAALSAAAALAAAADDAGASSRTTSAAASIVDKLRASLTDWMSVSDKELEQEYRRRNDKVKLARGQRSPRDSFRSTGDGDRRRRRRATSRRTRTTSGFRRSARSATCSSTSTRSARRSSCRRRTSSAPTTTTSSSTRRRSRSAPATSC